MIYGDLCTYATRPLRPLDWKYEGPHELWAILLIIFDNRNCGIKGLYLPKLRDNFDSLTKLRDNFDMAIPHQAARQLRYGHF